MIFLTKLEVLKIYMFNRDYQAVKEKVPGLGYILKHTNKFYFGQGLKLNE